MWYFTAVPSNAHDFAKYTRQRVIWLVKGYEDQLFAGADNHILRSAEVLRTVDIGYCTETDNKWVMLLSYYLVVMLGGLC